MNIFILVVNGISSFKGKAKLPYALKSFPIKYREPPTLCFFYAGLAPPGILESWEYIFIHHCDPST